MNYFYFIKKLALIFLLSASLFSYVQAADINFKNTPIRIIIEAVAKVTNKNFLIDPRVNGKATLIAPSSIKDEELYDALLAILTVHGFVAIPEGSITKIVPANVAMRQLQESESDRSDWIMDTIQVKYLSANKVVSILKPLITKNAYMVVLSETNQILIGDRSSNLARLRSVVKKIDISTTENYELIKLNHSTASEMLKLIQQVIGKSDLGRLYLVADSRTNRLILAGPEDLRIKVRAFVADMDTLEKSQNTAIRVIYLKHSKSEDIVSLLNSIVSSKSFLKSLTASAANAESQTSSSQPKNNNNQKQTGQNNSVDVAPEISIVSDQRINAILISAPAGITDALIDVIDRIDIRRSQVLIEAIIAEVSLSKANQLGVQWGWGGAEGVGFINFDNAIPSALGVLGGTTESAATAVSGVVGTGGTFGFGETSADGTWLSLIKAITSDTETSILSLPSIVTLDNEKASIISGQEVPFTTSSKIDNAGNPFKTIERKDVGISLIVTPQINAGGTVSMSIEQQISNILGSTQVEGAVDLITSKREIITNVEVGDGDALVLGGLIQDEKTNISQRVPMLGDIPYLGQLFSNNRNDIEKTNLMVFIRPKVIQNSEQGSFLTNNKYELIRKEQFNYYKNDNTNWLENSYDNLILQDIEAWTKENQIPFDSKQEDENDNNEVESEEEDLSDF